MQFAAGALLAVPFAIAGRGVVTAPAHATPVVALVALTAAGTVVPFWLFAHGQARVPGELAGAFVNLEPVVGAAVGWIAFGDVAGAAQLADAVAVLAGIALSVVPETTVRRLTVRPG